MKRKCGMSLQGKFLDKLLKQKGSRLRKKPLERLYDKYDDMFQCPCGATVNVRYNFGSLVSRKHFNKAREEYKKGER